MDAAIPPRHDPRVPVFVTLRRVPEALAAFASACRTTFRRSSSQEHSFDEAAQWAAFVDDKEQCTFRVCVGSKVRSLVLLLLLLLLLPTSARRPKWGWCWQVSSLEP